MIKLTCSAFCSVSDTRDVLSILYDDLDETLEIFDAKILKFVYSNSFSFMLLIFSEIRGVRSFLVSSFDPSSGFEQIFVALRRAQEDQKGKAKGDGSDLDDEGKESPVESMELEPGDKLLVIFPQFVLTSVPRKTKELKKVRLFLGAGVDHPQKTLKNANNLNIGKIIQERLRTAACELERHHTWVSRQ